ncbi:MAG: PD-(D/E)XK nuclease family protein [Nitrospinae bacterium]|nr:PD-(D/E)XK nuclease family protein [Nitrospinota bacterium]
MKPGLVIYPTKQRLTEAVIRLTAGPGPVSAVMPSVMTIGAFENKLTEEIVGHRKTISQMARAMLLSRLIEERRSSLPPGIFMLAKRFKGFVNATLSFFDELGAGLIGPADLENIRGYSPEKEGEIAALYNLYRSELERLNLWDSGMTRSALAQMAGDESAFASSPTLSSHSSITLRDIYQFTPYRFELFRKLALRIPVYIKAPVPDERRKAFGYLISSVEKFESLGGEEGSLDIEFEEPETGPLNTITSRIFDLSPKPDTPVTEDILKRVTVTLCPGRRREVEEACAAIIRIKRETGLDYKSFAVILRNADPYGPLIENVFNRYGTPFHFRKGIRLTANPLINAVLSVFSAIESGYERNAISAILLSPYFKRFSGLDGVAAQNLFTASRVIDGPPGSWRPKLERGVALLDERHRATAGKIREETLKLLDKLADFAAQSRPSAFFDSFADLLRYLELDPDPSAQTPMFERIRFRDNNAFMQLIETVADARDSVEALKIGGSPLGFSTLQSLLYAQLESRYIPEPGSTDLNGVAVLNAHDAVGSRFPVTIILGLIEGEFPVFPQPASILDEEERMSFNRIHAEAVKQNNPTLVKGRRVFDSWAEKWQEESLLFFQTIRTATDQIHLFHCEMGDDGEPLLASQFIEDTLEAINLKTVNVAPSLAIDRKPGELLDAEELRSYILRSVFREGLDGKTAVEKIAGMQLEADETTTLARLLRLTAVERSRDRYFIERDTKAKEALFSPFNGSLKEVESLIRNFHLLKRHGRTTPTDMEKYGQCPFRYFASRLLAMEPVEEPEPELDAKNMGTILHNIAERFYQRLMQEKALPLKGTDAEKSALLETARNVFMETENADTQGDPAIWRVEKRRIENLFRIWRAVEEEDQLETGFAPVAVEAGFDLPKNVRGWLAGPPLVLNAGDGNQRFIAGKIDRIDVNREKKTVRVVDYKSGSNRSRYNKMLKRENLGVTAFQVPAYMALAKKYIKEAKILDEVTGVFGGYRLMKSDTAGKAFVTDIPKPRGNISPIDDGLFLEPADSLPPNVAAGAFEALALGMIGNMEAGLYPVSPRTCEYCDFIALCRYIEAPAPEDEESES